MPEVVAAVQRRTNMLNNLGSYYSESARTTNFYKFIVSVADELTATETEIANTILDLGVDETRDDSLFRVFGTLLELTRRTDLDWDYDDYRWSIKMLLWAFGSRAVTTEGLNYAVRAITRVSPTIIEHYKYAGWLLSSHSLGVGLIVSTGFAHPWQQVYLTGTSDITDLATPSAVSVWLTDASSAQVFKSGDAGATFEDTLFPSTNPTLITAPNENIIWVVSGAGSTTVYRYVDTIWTSMFTAPTSISSIKAYTDHIVLTGLIDGTLYQTIDGGSSWSLLGTSSAILNAIDVWGTSKVVGVGGTNIYRNWLGTETNTTVAGVTFQDVAINPELSSMIVAIGNIAGSGVVYLSEDYGATWTHIETLAEEVFHLSYAFGELYAVAAADTIYKSVDNGTTWITEEYSASAAHSAWLGISMRPGGMGYIISDIGLLRKNGQSPGYTLSDGTHLANGELVNNAFLETGKGRTSTVDISVWLDTDRRSLVQQFLYEVLPAHLVVNYVPESTIGSDVYYGTDQYEYFDGSSRVVSDLAGTGNPKFCNGRNYRDSLVMLRIAKTEDSGIPQF